MIAIIPDAMPHVCLLVSPDLRAFSVPDDPARSIAASALVIQPTCAALALPGVAQAEAPIKAAFAGQLRRRREQVLATPPNSDASAAVLRFRDILGAHT